MMISEGWCARTNARPRRKSKYSQDKNQDMLAFKQPVKQDVFVTGVEDIKRQCRRLSSQSAALFATCLAGVLFGTQLFTLTRSSTAPLAMPSDSADQTLHSIARGARSVRTGTANSYGPGIGTSGSRTSAPSSEVDRNRGRKLLFVGVMTADVFLNSRAVAVHDTWASDLPGSHQFFTSEKSSGPAHLPIVRLKSVTDQYPPQKKSFMMFKYMYEHYGNQYEWFMRADDDVYVRTERLAKLLRGVNSSQPMFIGQAGQGSKTEFGHLSLDEKWTLMISSNPRLATEGKGFRAGVTGLISLFQKVIYKHLQAFEENFCMGGPGIVMSHATLSRIYPHIRYCLANMYTTHEDVEVGRCVKRFAGISCLWNYQMKEIFYNEYRGTEAFAGSLKQRSFLNAITLHPIKSPPLLYRLHHFFLSEMIREAQMTKVMRHRQIVSCTDEKDLHQLSPLTRRLGTPPMLNKEAVTSPDQVLTWSHMGHRFSINSARVADPRISAPRHLREGVRDATSSLMDYMLSFTQERGRSLSLQDHNYGYHRVDPLYGVDLILDLVLKYVRFRGKAMTQKVRRHAYLQQAFGEAEARVVARRHPRVVNLVVSVSGKLQPFLHFCQNVERIGLQGLRIVFVYHENADQEHADVMVHQLQQLQKKHGEAVSVVTTAQPFNRASSLMLGVSLLSDDDLLLLIDIDVLFDTVAIENVRQFVVQGKQVYFPVVFSEYDPNTGLVKHPSSSEDEEQSPPAPYSSDTSNSSQSHHFTINAERGKFRYYGFGICAIYKSDLKAVGGLNQEIHGWGKEDVDLMDRLLHHPSNYTVIRTAEPGMVHVHHPIHCSSQLTQEQTTMCKGTRYSFLASRRTLAWQACLDEGLLRFARHMHKTEVKPAASTSSSGGSDKRRRNNSNTKQNTK